jgi:hypothetical protein
MLLLIAWHEAVRQRLHKTHQFNDEARTDAMLDEPQAASESGFDRRG